MTGVSRAFVVDAVVVLARVVVLSGEDLVLEGRSRPAATDSKSS